jgi:tripartite ATP-independent transporter DctM subunit
MTTTLIIMAVLFLLFLFSGMPIAFALGVPSIFYMLFLSATPQSAFFVAHTVTTPLFSYVLIALPAFLLSGRMMNRAGITDRLFNLARAFVGRFHGGLAYVNVCASALFASMSGTAVGDTGGLGMIEMEMMNKAGYKREFSAGLTAASSVLGPLIPPSVAMVILGATAEISVGQLFLAGLIPGLLMMLALMVSIFVFSKTTTEGRQWPVDKVPKKEIWPILRRGFLPMLTPAIVIGGISSGIVTPTEAAILAIDYAIILGIFYKELTFKSFMQCVLDTVESSGTFMFIIACAGFFTWILTKEGLPQALGQIMAPLASMGDFWVLAAIGLLMLVVGCFLDTTAAILMVVPILMPIVGQLGINEIQFGVVSVCALMTGIITPPFGICLYVMSDVSKLPVSSITRQAVKYLPAMIAVLILCILFPAISTWLPGLVF